MKSVNIIFILVVLGLLPIASFSAPEPVNPKKQTPWKLYVDSKEAYDLKQKLGDKVLFIDVRDPVEIMFTGFTDVVDINIPFKMANKSRRNATALFRRIARVDYAAMPSAAFVAFTAVLASSE